MRMVLPSSAHWPTRPSPNLKRLLTFFAGFVAVAGDELEYRLGPLLAFGEEEGPVLRGHGRGELGHDELRDVEQIALPLHQTRDAG